MAIGGRQVQVGCARANLDSHSSITFTATEPLPGILHPAPRPRLRAQRASVGPTEVPSARTRRVQVSTHMPHLRAAEFERPTIAALVLVLHAAIFVLVGAMDGKDPARRLTGCG